MTAEHKAALGRRHFLRVLGVGAAAGAAAPLASEAVADSESTDDKRKARYRETDHIRNYYRVNQYPKSS